MPPSGKEVLLNEFEVYVMSWFVQKKVLDEPVIIEALKDLTAKLEGNYNEK